MHVDMRFYFWLEPLDVFFLEWANATFLLIGIFF